MSVPEESADGTATGRTARDQAAEAQERGPGGRRLTADDLEEMYGQPDIGGENAPSHTDPPNSAPEDDYDDDWDDPTGI